MPEPALVVQGQSASSAAKRSYGTAILLVPAGRRQSRSIRTGSPVFKEMIATSAKSLRLQVVADVFERRRAARDHATKVSISARYARARRSMKWFIGGAEDGKIDHCESSSAISESLAQQHWFDSKYSQGDRRFRWDCVLTP
jgi:hypothetical protein